MHKRLMNRPRTPKTRKSLTKSKMLGRPSRLKRPTGLNEQAVKAGKGQETGEDPAQAA